MASAGRHNDLRHHSGFSSTLESASVSPKQLKHTKSVQWLPRYSGGTFTSFYLRNYCPKADRICKAGPVVAAVREWLSPYPPRLVTCINSIAVSLVGPFGSHSFFFKKGGRGIPGDPLVSKMFHLWDMPFGSRKGMQTAQPTGAPK